MLEHFAGGGGEIGAGDFDLLAEEGRGDFLGELVGGLVVKLGDLAVAVFVVDDALGDGGGHPDIDVELQGHGNLRDGDSGVSGVGFARLAADTGAGAKIGIAFGGFSRG